MIAFSYDPNQPKQPNLSLTCCSDYLDSLVSPQHLFKVVFRVSWEVRKPNKERKMQTTAKRRLDAVSRHFLHPSEPNSMLHQVFLRGGQLQNQEMEAEAVIVGGMVLDIHATPFVPANPRTTAPGKVHYVLGGVARNVAECMSKLGAKPYMISALGLDMAGNLLLEHWKSAGLSTEGIRRQQDIDTAVVCNILDVNGELASAVASVEAVEKFLTPEWIQLFKCKISSAPVLMVDANLNPLALEASCQFAEESHVPVWFEPVSVTKSRRIASVVKYVTVTSPNEDELVAMANALSGENTFRPISRKKYSTESLFQILKPAILVLLENGIKVVIVTLGLDGVFFCSKGGANAMRIGPERTKPYGFSRKLYDIMTSSCPSTSYFGATQPEGGSQFFAVHFPALPASVVRLTGPGDCLVGGTLASICAGLDLMQSLAVGIAASKAAVEVETNVPSEFCLTTIADDAKTVYAAAKVLFNQSRL